MSILSIRDKDGKMQEVLALRGPRGLTGETGPKGDNGLSAYQIWLNNGNSGTEEDFLASLKGPQGDGLNKEAVEGIVKEQTANKLDKSGYEPNMFLGTDGNGNVVTVDTPGGDGGAGVWIGSENEYNAAIIPAQTVCFITDATDEPETPEQSGVKQIGSVVYVYSGIVVTQSGDTVTIGG